MSELVAKSMNLTQEQWRAVHEISEAYITRLEGLLRELYEDQGLVDFLEGEDNDYGGPALRTRKLVQRIKVALTVANAPDSAGPRESTEAG